MIVLRNKFFSEEEKSSGNNVLKSVGTGLAVAVPSLAIGSGIAYKDSSNFLSKNYDRLKNTFDQYHGVYKNEYDQKIKNISEKHSKLLKKTLNERNSFTTNVNSSYDPARNVFRLQTANSRMRNKALKDYNSNYQKLDNRISNMRNRVTNAARKRFNKGLAIAGLASVGLGTAAGLITKNKLDNKKDVNS